MLIFRVRAIYDCVRGLILGYRVHLACDAETDMPLAFNVASANVNEKRLVDRLLNKLYP